MSTSIVGPRVETEAKTERPKVYKVILLNDDYTPRAFVVGVLRSVFRMTTDEAHAVMLTAHMQPREWLTMNVPGVSTGVRCMACRFRSKT